MATSGYTSSSSKEDYSPEAKLKQKSMTRHIYIDESGDTTFYGRHRRPLLGSEGVSNYFHYRAAETTC